MGFALNNLTVRNLQHGCFDVEVDFTTAGKLTGELLQQRLNTLVGIRSVRTLHSDTILSLTKNALSSSQADVYPPEWICRSH
jgi:hypothetical protein